MLLKSSQQSLITYEVERCNLSSLQKRSVVFAGSVGFIAGEQKAVMDNTPGDPLGFFFRGRCEEAGNSFF